MLLMSIEMKNKMTQRNQEIYTVLICRASARFFTPSASISFQARINSFNV